jgi:hypothetical protein
MIACERATWAILFTFPHRCNELQEYGIHINELFTSLPDLYHQRVINYNKAVQKRWAKYRDMLLNKPT